MTEFNPTEGGGTAITWRIRLEDRGSEAIAKFAQEMSNIRIGFPIGGPQMIMRAINQDIDAFALDEDHGAQNT
jgi:hypothetical protein